MSPIRTTLPTRVAVIGAGQRGLIYARYILQHPEEAIVTAVAEPRIHRRKTVATDFSLAPENVYADWKDLFKGPKVADAVVIAVMDDLHREVVDAFANAGYDILCEKPMATSAADCISMYKDIVDNNVIFGVGHVLRYSPYNVAIKDIIESGALGDIVNIQHIEPVGFHHYVHSYVRGNWRNESTSSFALMTKCCHDVDILAFYLGGSSNPPKKVSSFGSLFHFRPERKPEQAKGATKCLECPYESPCAWSAKKAYLDPVTDGLIAQGENRAKHFVEADTLDIENVTDALRKTGYGDCVYNGQNDVTDHQVVNIEYANGATASLTMSAFTESECFRKTVIHGTKGELVGDMTVFSVFDFASKTRKDYIPPAPNGGHGGGDAGITRAFLQAVRERRQSLLKVEPLEMLNSHLLVFAAEASRVEGKTVDFDQFAKAAGM